MEMRLIRYVSQAGIASRRKSGDLIKAGEVTVNGIICRDPAYLVQEADDVAHKNQKLSSASEYIYILLNKPLGVVSASEDNDGERTVIDLIVGYDKSRLFPVGRLDKMTTGLLLITNDGDLTYKLTHPKFNINKEYCVLLNRPLRQGDGYKLLNGVELDDGVSAFDMLMGDLASCDLRVSLHSGKNRIIRRTFAALNYEIEALHRSMFGFLTLGSLPIGQYRELTIAEIEKLKEY